MSDNAFVHVRDLRVVFRRDGQTINAVNGVSFEVQKGEVMALIGESGSGKSTLARLVMALDTPSAGSVQLLGQDLHRLGNQALRMARRDFQMVFQDPYGSLDPRMTVEHIVCEPLTAQARSPARPGPRHAGAGRAARAGPGQVPA